MTDTDTQNNAQGVPSDAQQPTEAPSQGAGIPNDVFGTGGKPTAPSNPDAGRPQVDVPPTAQTPAAPEQKRDFLFKSGGLGSKSDVPGDTAPQGTQRSIPTNAPAKKSPAKKSSAAKAPKKSTNAESNTPRGALNAVVTRNEYYRDGYRNIMKIALVEGLVIILMIVTFIVYTNIHRGQDRYFATTADGRILQLLPLDQPNMSTAALMSWVSQAATEVMTFGFHDYQRRLQDASRHFTRRGWESFTVALQRSRIIEGVEKLQQVVTAAPGSAPVLIQEGIFNNRYRWVVRLPLTVTYRSGSQNNTTNLDVTITIERVPTLESPNGVGIESWIAQ